MSIVIVGAGQAGLQIAESLRRGAYEGRLVLIGDESFPPYQRPPLSKKYLADQMADERLYFRPLEQLEKQQIEFRPQTRVTALDREAREVVLASGERLPYEGLALTTGTRVRPLPVPGADHPAVCYLRGLDDARRLRERLPAAARVLVVGGGFIGLEVAATARAAGKQVTVVEALDRLMARAVAPVVSDHFASLHRARGVEFRFGVGLASIAAQADGSFIASLADGSSIEADLLVAGIGVLPNQELAVAAGLECRSGIVVDEYARTSDPRIVAAGDCTWHINRRFAAAHRLESVQNAVDQGKIAAASLLGHSVPYQDLPWFWSDQYDVKLQMVGLSQDHDAALVRGEPASGAFSVFYFKTGALVGVDSINRPAEHMLARKLMQTGAVVPPEAAADPAFDLKTCLPPA